MCSAERFWSKVNKTDSCWHWTGYVRRDGYGKFSIGGIAIPAHRFAWELMKGPIPEGLVIDHLCRVRDCVNPTHLEPVTVGENTRRGLALSQTLLTRRERTHCKRGHEFAGDNLYIDPRGWRACRTCRNAAHQKYAQALAGEVA